MFLNDLISEANESIVTHHKSGYLTRERAVAGLTANGLTVEQANTLLDQPVDVALFFKHQTWPCDSALLPMGTAPVQPCVKSLRHDGKHQNARGTTWIDPPETED